MRTILPPPTHYLLSYLTILLLAVTNIVFSQDKQDYYLELKDGIILGTIQKTIRTNGTIQITTNNPSFSNFINSKQVYELRKAFPTSVTPWIEKVYFISLNSNESISNFENRTDIERLITIETPTLDSHYPNDYIEIVEENLFNTPLELIKAPLAWNITKGDPNIIVGIVDGGGDPYHPDLVGKVLQNFDDYNYGSNDEDYNKHGTGVANIIGAKTNNNYGAASIGYLSSLIIADGFGITNRVLEISQIPGVKVINCSWSGSSYNQVHEAIYQEIADRGVVVVCAAGNNDYTLRRYPASYESTISVSTVGNRYPIGFYHNIQNPNNAGLYLTLSWKDVHDRRPNPNDPNAFYGGTTRNDKVDVTAPGMLFQGIILDPLSHSGYSYSIRDVGTSASAAYVSGLAALIFSINPSFTAQEVKDIIKNTADDVYYIPSNQDFIGQLGTGRINAYRAVLTADCMTNPTPGLDLAMQNSKLDSFEEPDTGTLQPWQSEDIWVRNQNDGILVRGEHQNPEYDPNNPNYAYVQVTNNSCVTSSGNDVLKLYWAKASTSLAWPDPWDGSVTIYDEVDEVDVLMGDEIGSMSIPSLEIGQSTILEFPWNVPNPADYENINNAPWHFCLLARIESPDDPMTTPEGSFLTDNVLNNNNIAWKNMTIVDIEPNSTTISAALAVGNPSNLTNSYTVNFSEEALSQGKALYEEAEITIEMDDTFYNAWDTGGRQSNDTNPASIAANNRKHRVIGNSASFNNVQLAPGEIGTLTFSFNFLIDEMTTKKKFIYHVEQIDESTNKLLGGETFIVNKQTRESFAADSGDDKDIERNESATITAAQINEAAVYNWYDPEGNLIYTGPTLTVSPEVTKTYRLEVISDSDGYKDYDEVTVNVAPYHLDTLVPNPATNSVTVSYVADQATSAYLMVVGTNNNTSNNYILDTELTSINLDISSYPTGVYAVALVCDGDIVDSKQLIKQ